MAVTNLSQKLQVHWVGPFQVTKIVNECQTQLCVDGKSVIVHNRHLLKATGDKPPIVALRQFLATSQNFQEFVRWQVPPNKVFVQRRARQAAPTVGGDWPHIL